MHLQILNYISFEHLGLKEIIEMYLMSKGSLKVKKKSKEKVTKYLLQVIAHTRTANTSHTICTLHDIYATINIQMYLF